MIIQRGTRTTAYVADAYWFERTLIGWFMGNVNHAPMASSAPTVLVEYEYAVLGSCYKSKSIRSFATVKAAREYLHHFRPGAGIPIRFVNRFPRWSAIDPDFPPR